MFFIGIFGIESNDKEIKSFTGVVCPCCGRLTKAVLFMSYTYFHIFFIPTFRWNRRYYVKLRCCGALYAAPEDYAKQLKTADDIDFSRLKKVSGGFGGFEAPPPGGGSAYECPRCGKSVDKSFPYCPYCGAKQ